MNTLLNDSLAALRQWGLHVELDSKRKPDGSDQTIRIRTGQRTLTYETSVKRMTPVVDFAHGLDGGRRDRLLITDYVDPARADRFRKLKAQFIDTAGNAYLERGELFVFVSGRPAPPRKPATRRSLAFGKSGVKLAFVLLTCPGLLQASARQLASAAGIALGSVPGVLAALRDLGYLEEIRGKKRLLNTERLIAQWTEAYARVLEPSLSLQRFTGPRLDWWKKLNASRYGIQWGGETAAAILTDELIPQQIVFYGDDVPTRLVIDKRLESHPSGPVIARKRFWHFDPELPSRDVVPPLLIHADLVVTGDPRLLKIAQTIRDDFVLRLLRER